MRVQIVKQLFIQYMVFERGIDESEQVDNN